MEPEFWHERWRLGQTGFHLGVVNPQLVKHYTQLQAPGAAPARILVPLCGKSLDLGWLADRGHEVVGVELSELAVHTCFAERGLDPDIDTLGPYRRHRAGKLELLCGDVFDLRAEHVGAISALYDRAALVALPEPMRARYVPHLAGVVPSGTRGLLVSFEYEPEHVGGPPFSVHEREVRALYEPFYTVTLLAREDILDAEPRFRERGITSLHECVYALTRR